MPQENHFNLCHTFVNAKVAKRPAFISRSENTLLRIWVRLLPAMEKYAGRALMRLKK
jgi:hypothetical protein